MMFAMRHFFQRLGKAIESCDSSNYVFIVEEAMTMTNRGALSSRAYLIAGSASPSLTRLARVTITGRSLKLPSTLTAVTLSITYTPLPSSLTLTASFFVYFLTSPSTLSTIPPKLRRSSNHTHHGGQSRCPVPGGYDAAHGCLQHAVDQVSSTHAPTLYSDTLMLTTAIRTCNASSTVTLPRSKTAITLSNPSSKPSKCSSVRWAAGW
jgi:hypothetical protein